MAPGNQAAVARRTRLAATSRRDRALSGLAGFGAVLLLAGCGGGNALPPPSDGPARPPTSSASQAEKDEQVDDLNKCLVGHWMHSREEDTTALNVYRPATYAFPPARGRTGYQFHPDGRLTYFGIAAGDGSSEHGGRWVAEDSHRVKIMVDGRAAPEVWDVVDCDEGTLTVKR